MTKFYCHLMMGSSDGDKLFTSDFERVIKFFRCRQNRNMGTLCFSTEHTDCRKHWAARQESGKPWEFYPSKWANRLQKELGTP